MRTAHTNSPNRTIHFVLEKIMRRALLCILISSFPFFAQADFASDLSEAESDFAAGEYEDALMGYALLVKQPEGAPLLFKQAEACYYAALKARLGKVDERLEQAATILIALLGKSPNQPNVHAHLARIYLTQALKATGQERVEWLEKARDEALQELAINDLNPLANQVLGRWHLEVATLRTLARKVYTAVSGTERQASLKEAKKLLLIATEQAPADVTSWMALAQVLDEQKESDEAKSLWEKTAGMTPHNSGDELAIQEAKKHLKPKTKITLPKLEW